ncbi:hypothetical protein SeMB42_g04930 [Synchytrium endobioticum]|uniref:THO complex subunit 2 n=1 Tax=Synchytrium endobioticum TaxID=286115 RepID=A0A507CUT9_9FUNG|nr:hypothetical protein SeMB42_g04930 [Synchytrium endobioticum]
MGLYENDTLWINVAFRNGAFALLLQNGGQLRQKTDPAICFVGRQYNSQAGKEREPTMSQMPTTWQSQMDTWDSGGRQNLLETAVEYSAYEPSPDIARENHLGILSIIRDIFKAVVTGRLRATSAASFLAEWHRNLAGSSNSNGENASKDNDGQSKSTQFELNEGLNIASLVVDALDTFHATTERSMVAIYGLNDDGSGAEMRDVPRARLEEFARAIVEHKFVPIEKLLSVMENDFIEAIAPHLGLRSTTRDKSYSQHFSSKSIKYSTSILYKQTKFNLLREESEGFAKLVTELTFDLPPPVDSWVTAYTLPGETSIREKRIKIRVNSMLQNIKSIIGYFFLDPNRVLDIILDVFAMDVKDQWDFFMELLRVSPWRKSTSSAAKKGSSSSNTSSRDRIAQVLGFKFQYYKHPDAAPATLKSLYHVAALLIRHKVMDMAELYPYLHPLDEDMEKEYDVYIKDTEYRSQSSRFESAQDNLLASAGGLDDRSGTADNVHAGVVATGMKRMSDERSKLILKNQKANLVETLLAVGAFSEALLILNRFPSLPAMFPDLAYNFLRCLHEFIEPFYRPTCSEALAHATQIKLAPTKEFVAQIQAPFPTASTDTKLCPLPTNVFDLLSQGKKLSTTRYRFYYPHWKELLKPPSEPEAFLRSLRGFLTYIGPNLSKDLLLANKIARMGAHMTKEGASTHMKQQWLLILSQHLLPALSLSDSNPAFSYEIWKIVANYPYQVRWHLYQDWADRSNDQDKYPDMWCAKIICVNDVKFIMKRLSHENIRIYGRGIGKVVHSNPTTALNELLRHITGDNMDNFINLIVDASRYLSELDFDVLAYSLVRQLESFGKKTSEDNLTPNAAFTAFARFVGTVYRKHQTELEGLLEYLKQRFEEGEMDDLLVLAEVVGQMSTLRFIENPSDKGLDGMAGGDTLRRESLMLERHLRKHSARLATALKDANVAHVYAILMGQMIRDLPYREYEETGDARKIEDLKEVTIKLDKVKQVFLQYIDFYSTCVPDPTYYVATFPSLRNLVEVYGLETEVAFHIVRPTLTHLINQNPHPDDGIDATNAMDIDEDVNNVWEPALRPIIEDVQDLLPQSVANKLPLPLYVTFWQLSLYDIHIPRARYIDEIRIQMEAKDKALMESNRPDIDSSGRKRAIQDATRASLTVDALRKELNTHVKVHDAVKRRLQRERKYWLPAYDRGHATEAFSEQCLFARAIISYADAEFSAKFLFLMHQLCTRNFATVFALEKVMNDRVIRVMLVSNTELETRCLALFYRRVLQTLMPWFADRSKYKAEALGEGKPGFIHKWDPSGAYNALDMVDVDKIVSYEQFRTAIRRWHGRLFSAISSALASGIDVQKRNALLFANGIIEQFPYFETQGKQMLDVLSNPELEVDEWAPDLKQLVISYRGNVQAGQEKWREKQAPRPINPPAAVPPPIQAAVTPAPAPSTNTAPTIVSASPIAAPGTVPSINHLTGITSTIPPGLRAGVAAGPPALPLPPVLMTTRSTTTPPPQPLPTAAPAGASIGQTQPPPPGVDTAATVDVPYSPQETPRDEFPTPNPPPVDPAAFHAVLERLRNAAKVSSAASSTPPLASVDAVKVSSAAANLASTPVDAARVSAVSSTTARTTSVLMEQKTIDLIVLDSSTPEPIDMGLKPDTPTAVQHSTPPNTKKLQKGRGHDAPNGKERDTYRPTVRSPSPRPSFMNSDKYDGNPRRDDEDREGTKGGNISRRKRSPSPSYSSLRRAEKDLGPRERDRGRFNRDTDKEDTGSKRRSDSRERSERRRERGDRSDRDKSERDSKRDRKRERDFKDFDRDSAVKRLRPGDDPIVVLESPEPPDHPSKGHTFSSHSNSSTIPVPASAVPPQSSLSAAWAPDASIEPAPNTNSNLPNATSGTGTTPPVGLPPNPTHPNSIPIPPRPITSHSTFSIVGSSTRNTLKRAAEEAANSTRVSPNPSLPIAGNATAVSGGPNPSITFTNSFATGSGPGGGWTSSQSQLPPPSVQPSSRRSRTEPVLAVNEVTIRHGLVDDVIISQVVGKEDLRLLLI